MRRTLLVLGLVLGPVLTGCPGKKQPVPIGAPDGGTGEVPGGERTQVDTRVPVHDRVDEAVAAFKASLKPAPNNGWALYGLMEAQKKLGDAAGAKESEAALAKAWIGSRELLVLSNL